MQRRGPVGEFRSFAFQVPCGCFSNGSHKMSSAQSLAHKRFPKLFGVGDRETALFDYPCEHLRMCVACNAVTGAPNVISCCNSLHAIPENAQFVEMLQQVDSTGQVIPDHFVTAVCPPLPKPTPSNPHPRPSKAKHYSCYFPSDFLNPSFIFHGHYAGGFRAILAATGVSVVIKRIDLRRLRSLRANYSKLVVREKALLQRLSNSRIPRMIQQYVDPLDDEFVYFVLEDGGTSTLANLMRSSMMSSVALKPSIVKSIMTDVRESRLRSSFFVASHTAIRCSLACRTSTTITSCTAISKQIM